MGNKQAELTGTGLGAEVLIKAFLLWSKIRAMKPIFKRLVLCLSLVCVIVAVAGCKQQIPDVSFGGSHAVYEIGDDQVVDPYALPLSAEVLDKETPVEPAPTDSVESAEDATATKPGETASLEETLTPKPTDVLGATPEPSAETTVESEPSAEPTQGPEGSATPSPKPLNEKEAFFAYWAGEWAFWFESSGRLLEGKLKFERSEDTVVGKTEIDGQSHSFTVTYTKGQDFFETFVHGIWVAEGMQNGMVFRLKAVSDTQAAGHHSRPSQTFCMARDAAHKPDPCFLPLFN